MPGTCSGLRKLSIAYRSDGDAQEENHMPTYEFHCNKCDKSFEQIWSLSDYDKRIKEKRKCPSCGSTRVVKTISEVQVKTSKKS